MHTPGSVAGLVGPLCGFVAALAAALAAVLKVMIVDPPSTELRVPPPADPLGCGATGWADYANDTRAMALRALKRRIGRPVYGHLRQDYRARQTGDGRPQ